MRQGKQGSVAVGAEPSGRLRCVTWFPASPGRRLLGLLGVRVRAVPTQAKSTVGTSVQYLAVLLFTFSPRRRKKTWALSFGVRQDRQATRPGPGLGLGLGLVVSSRPVLSRRALPCLALPLPSVCFLLSCAMLSWPLFMCLYPPPRARPHISSSSLVPRHRIVPHFSLRPVVCSLLLVPLVDLCSVTRLGLGTLLGAV